MGAIGLKAPLLFTDCAWLILGAFWAIILPVAEKNRELLAAEVEATLWVKVRTTAIILYLKKLLALFFLERTATHTLQQEPPFEPEKISPQDEISHELSEAELQSENNVTAGKERRKRKNCSLAGKKWFGNFNKIQKIVSPWVTMNVQQHSKMA